MATRSDQEGDDDFDDIYKAYTGPVGVKPATTQEKPTTKKRSIAGSDEEEEARDPNAVPTDFTSREAKVWEAKSKATERNWKKRKEEELICKICGESGHFTQGCPSTLGANRKSQDFFERVPAREKHVKALFTPKAIQNIEKDIGCKIKMDEKFIIVSGKDRLILAKGVDSVRKFIEENGDRKGSSSSRVTRSRTPERSPVSSSRFPRSDSQRSHSNPRVSTQFQQRFNRPEKPVEDRVRDNLPKFSRDSLQAYGNEGARIRSNRSKSPVRPPYTSSTYSHQGGRNQTFVPSYSNEHEGWQTEREMPAVTPFDHHAFTKTLEDLEMEFRREAVELGRVRDKEEDEENYKHREAIRETRENYTKKLAVLRATQAKQWEEFLQADIQNQRKQQVSSSGYGGYKHQGYSSYGGSNIVVDSMNRYPNPNPSPMENYPSRPKENFGEYQRLRREDYGKPYNRY